MTDSAAQAVASVSSRVLLPKLMRAHARAAFEEAPKVRRVVKAQLLRQFGHGGGDVEQAAAGFAGEGWRAQC